MKKSQIWSFDFVISVVIFIIVVITLLFTLEYTSTQANEHVNINRMERTALLISDSLIRSPGVPESWNISTVEIIGLAKEENVLNETKVAFLLNLTNEQIKTLLGIEAYNFYIELRNSNNETLEVDGKPIIKGDYPSNAHFVIPVERVVLFGNTISKLLLILWI